MAWAHNAILNLGRVDTIIDFRRVGHIILSIVCKHSFALLNRNTSQAPIFGEFYVDRFEPVYLLWRVFGAFLIHDFQLKWNLHLVQTIVFWINHQYTALFKTKQFREVFLKRFAQTSVVFLTHEIGNYKNRLIQLVLFSNHNISFLW